MRGFSGDFEHSHSEIARELNLKKNTVISLERSALRKIKRLLSSIDSDFSQEKPCSARKKRGANKDVDNA